MRTAVFLFLFSALTLSAQNFINGQAARAVIGQTVFTGSQLYPSVNILGAAGGVAYANGTLFVADDNSSVTPGVSCGSNPPLPCGTIPHDNRVVLFHTDEIPGVHDDIRGLGSYSSSNCNLCGFSAYLSLGQASWTPTDTTAYPGYYPIFDGGTGPTGMLTPVAVASDGTALAVADMNNNRVLLWRSMPTSMDQPADVVLGEPDFTSNSSNRSTSASTLLGPQGVWIQNGKLFVADTLAYRVLIWNSIPTSNGQPADVVLGEPNLTTPSNPKVQNPCPTTGKSGATASPAANVVCQPVSVTSDGTHLFVADYGFNRVLIWNSIPTTNGQPADVVVGQPDMVSATENNPSVCSAHSLPQTASTTTTIAGGTTVTLNYPCQDSLSSPTYALSDGTRLFIADGGNDRVLIYNSIPTTNGAVADEVLGSPNFTTTPPTSQNISIASTAIDNNGAVDVIPNPTSLAWDGTNLYVADPTDNRILVFSAGDTQLPSNSVLNWASEIIRQEAVVTVAVTTITAGDTASVSITPPNTSTANTYTYTVKKGDTADTIAQGLVSAINSSNNGAGDPSATAIFPGATAGTTSYLYLSSKGTDLSFDAIAISPTESSNTDLSLTTSGAYLSSGTASTASPGMLVEVDGTNLSDVPSGSPITAPLAGNLPTALGGVEVYMDGVATPILSASSTQIITQVPYGFSNRNSTSVYVRTNHNNGTVTVTNATPVYIAPANPGIFSAPSSPGQARPWPATGAYHQPGNPNAVVDLEGTPKAGDTATITVNGRSHTYTAASGDTLTNVQNGLVNVINLDNDPQVTASAGPAFNRVVITARQAGAAGTGIPISTSSSSDLTLTAYTTSTCCAVTPNSPITASNPAGPGEMITLSGAGLGLLLDPAAAAAQITGAPYNGLTPNSAANSVSATMGGSTAQVVAAGLPTGSYGTYQIQMIVPTNLSGNDQTQVYIAQNAFISNIATIAVGTPKIVTPSGGGGTSSNTPGTVGPVQINIDAPQSGATLSGITPIGGWAFDSNVNIATVIVGVDGVTVGGADYGGARPDVCAVKGQVPGCPNLAWNFMLDSTRYADGTHQLEITATAVDGTRATISRSFTSSNYSGIMTGALPMKLNVDSPNTEIGSVQGTINISGWAINDNAPIATLSFSIDGVQRGTITPGTAARQDVCAVYRGRPGCPNVGWSTTFDTTTLSNGSHVLTLEATAADGEYAAINQNFTVANYTSLTNPIHLNIDAPGPQSGAYTGAAAFGGWAVADDTVIAAVTVTIDGVFYGNAGYGGTRNDVCAALPNRPGCPNVGWNFLLDTTQLPDAQHTLAVTAIPVVGQSYTITRTFYTANNATAGGSTVIGIDIPGIGAAPYSGAITFAGWAANPGSAISAVQIFVDGQLKGNAQYGGARPDVCANSSVANAPGCPNVGWGFPIDTTQISNGRHIMEVTAISASGQKASNSVPFTVNNPTSGPTSAYISQPSANSNPFIGIATFTGLASNSNGTPIASVSVTVDGIPSGTAAVTSSGGSGLRPATSWSFAIDTTRLSDGTHTLGVTATATDGTQGMAFAAFMVENWISASSSNPIQIGIDIPNGLNGPFTGTSAHFGGWAVDSFGTIASVDLAVDGVPIGTAMYGDTSRPDVCSALPSAGCPKVGWDAYVDTTVIANGSHTLEVTAVNAAGQSATSTAQFSVLN